jgi:hypothetical protein
VAAAAEPAESPSPAAPHITDHLYLGTTHAINLPLLVPQLNWLVCVLPVVCLAVLCSTAFSKPLFQTHFQT